MPFKAINHEIWLSMLFFSYQNLLSASFIWALKFVDRVVFVLTIFFWTPYFANFFWTPYFAILAKTLNHLITGLSTSQQSVV